MTKILVDRLPYTYNDCPFRGICDDAKSEENCPILWDKYKWMEDNPHECWWFKEVSE